MSATGATAAPSRSGEACWTAREIAQQPRTWRAIEATLRAQESDLHGFLQPLLAQRDLRIVLTGAGSSAFIGQCLAPQLQFGLGRRVEAIATTDIVSAPEQWLLPQLPTLLVSFARSGSSPESLAAVTLATRLVQRCHHLIVTCNADGELHRSVQSDSRARSLLLPPETHDRSFAMTSSFSGMLLTALGVLQPEVLARVGRLADAAQQVLDQEAARFATLAADDYARVVYLGSGPLAGLAQEAALKLLELSDGRVVTAANSSLGFRHGPKAIVDRNTLVCVLLSNDPLTRRYDVDLLRELRQDGIARTVLAYSARRADVADEDLLVAGMDDASDSELCLPYVIGAQLYAYQCALRLGIEPDNPSASGTVSRVVRGVVIHHR